MVDSLTHLCRMDSSTTTVWTGLYPIAGCLVGNYYYYFFKIEIPVFNAYSVNPDQTPHSAASDLGLLCLPMSLLWDARHK